MSKKNKGFTLVEVIVAVALVGIIAVGIIPAFAAQFKMTIDARNLTTTGFQAQGVMEDEIQQVKELLKADESYGGGLPQDSVSIFGRNVSLYKINKEFPLNDRKSFIIFLSEKLAEMEYRNPLVTGIIRIDGEENSGSVNQGIAVASVRGDSTLVRVRGYFEITDYTSSQDLNLYRWYRSKEGISDPKIFPDDYEFVEAWRNLPSLTKAQLKEYAVNRHLILSFVPVDKSGVRGAEKQSQQVYIQGDEWRAGTNAWVDKNEDGIDDIPAVDVLLKIPSYAENWVLWKSGGFSTQNEFPNPDRPEEMLNPKDGSLYVPMGVARPQISEKIGTIKITNDSNVIDWNVYKSIHFANQLDVTNDSGIQMATIDGSIRIYQRIQIDARGDAVYSGNKAVLTENGAKLKASKNIILHGGDQWGGIYLEPYTVLEAGGNIELLAAETISIAAKQSSPAAPGLKATGTITLESKKRDIQIQKTMITAGKLLLKSNTKMVGGGWSSGTVVEVPDGKVLTVEMTGGAVQNNGSLVLGNTGGLVFSTGMGDLAQPLNLSLSRGDSSKVIISNDYGRNAGYADSSNGYQSIGSSGDYHDLGTGQTNLKLAVNKIRGSGSPSLSYTFDGVGTIHISASGDGGEEGYNNYYELTVADKYAAGVAGVIQFRVSAGKEGSPSVEILGPAIPRYTVTFDGDGGTPALTAKEVEEGTAIGAFPSVTKTFFELAGWYTEKGGNGTRVTEDFVVYGPITVYAHWTNIPMCVVTFDKNGGTVDASPNQISVVRGSKIGSLPQPPKRPGYVFKEWRTRSGQGNQGEVFDANSTVGGDMTVYARWTTKRPFSEITLGQYAQIKNKSNQNVLFQKIDHNRLLARELIGSGDMRWSAAVALAANYPGSLEPNWINGSGLVEKSTLDKLDRTNIRKVSYYWWGGESSRDYAYRVDTDGGIAERVKESSSATYHYSCRPYITVNTTSLYISGGAGTSSNPFTLEWDE